MSVSNARQVIAVLVATNLITYASAIAILRALRKQDRRHKKLAEMILYLSDLIEKHDVPLTEFDAIVLSQIAKEHNAARG